MCQHLHDRSMQAARMTGVVNLTHQRSKYISSPDPTPIPHGDETKPLHETQTLKKNQPNFYSYRFLSVNKDGHDLTNLNLPPPALTSTAVCNVLAMN